MRQLRFHLAELVLAVVFLGLFTALVVVTWGDLFFVHGLVLVGSPLFLGYLLLVIMLRQHREKRKGQGSGLR